MSKHENKIKGNLGENIACEYLEKDGYRIITRNFNCFYGEIDIIAIKNSELIFIEVKTRCQNEYGQPIEAINFEKLKHLYNSASYFMHKQHLSNVNVRFDAIEVVLFCSHDYKIKHTQNIITENPNMR